jgi:hypothetical protein
LLSSRMEPVWVKKKARLEAAPDEMECEP